MRCVNNVVGTTVSTLRSNTPTDGMRGERLNRFVCVDQSANSHAIT